METRQITSIVHLLARQTLLTSCQNLPFKDRSENGHCPIHNPHHRGRRDGNCHFPSDQADGPVDVCPVCIDGAFPSACILLLSGEGVDHPTNSMDLHHSHGSFDVSHREKRGSWRVAVACGICCDRSNPRSSRSHPTPTRTHGPACTLFRDGMYNRRPSLCHVDLRRVWDALWLTHINTSCSISTL